MTVLRACAVTGTESAGLVIIGSGAAGLMAALSAAPILREDGIPLLVIDANENPGVKLSLTAQGRCNLTNRKMDSRFYHGASTAFIRHALSGYNVTQTEACFRQIGIILHEEVQGRCYPKGVAAAGVTKALYGAARQAGAEFIFGEKILSVGRSKSGGIDNFEIRGAARRIFARRLIVATGGMSYPRTGSDGSGYAIARSFGHTVTRLAPALTALRRQGHPGWSALSGVAFEVEVKMRVDGKGVESRQGSVLVTHQGFSGPAVMDLSRSAALAREGACVEVVFDFALGYDESALEHLIGSARRQPKVAGVLARELKLPRRLAEFLADDEQERQGVYWSRRPEKTRRKLLGRIRHYPVPLDGVEGFERAEVTAGGVDTADVRHATMESKLVSGLYFAGEILDVDGCVGGYNLQWAWTSGALAGRAAAESLR